MKRDKPKFHLFVGKFYKGSSWWWELSEKSKGGLLVWGPLYTYPTKKAARESAVAFAKHNGWEIVNNESNQTTTNRC